jgi:superoxide dismutase, Fe-Mn family
MAFILPELPYRYSALEPYIDKETMVLHHDRHHAGYVARLNGALAGLTKWQEKTIEEILSSVEKLGEDIRQKVINSGGGHANHSLFWKVMSSSDSEGSIYNPNSELAKAIVKEFGSISLFKNKFTEEAMNIFGSGWEFLVLTQRGTLALRQKKNQDSPLMDNEKPILALDVWEHAYYLKYLNQRDEYITAWWNVVNWREVESLFESK